MLQQKYRHPAIIGLVVLISLFLVSIGTVQGQEGGPAPPPAGVEVDIEALNAGFKLATEGPCKGMYEVEGLGLCTVGFHMTTDNLSLERVPPLEAEMISAQSSQTQCDGDGTSGKRIQVIYAHPPDVDRYDEYLASFQQWMADMDEIFNASAAETGGSRHVRFVHGADCKPVVLNVEVSSAAMAASTPDQMWTELDEQGYRKGDRKYVVFAETNAYPLGIGTFAPDTQLAPDNQNNSGPSYTSTPVNLWGGSNPAHELMHTLGAVLGSPNSTGYGHCTDEYDRMCYVDGSGLPMTYPCSDPNHEQRFDCGHDDYYHTDPPNGNYLHTNWNPANSSFLIGAKPFRKTWTGAVSTDWTNTANWDSNYPESFASLPANGDDCLIPAGQPRYPVINSLVPSCAELIVEAGAHLTIEDGLEVETALISGTVEVKNGSYFDGYSAITVKPGGRLVLQNGDVGMFFRLPDSTLMVEGMVEVTGTFPIYAGHPVDPQANDGQSANLVIKPGGLVEIGPDGDLFVDGAITNQGTLKQTRPVTQSSTVSFLTWAGKYYGLDITLAPGGDMGSTTVEIQGNQACPEANILTDTVRRCYQISPATPQTAMVKFYYTASEGLFHPAPRAYHYNGTSWDELASTYGGSGDASYVQATGVNSYSPFALLDPNAVIYRTYLPAVLKD